MRQKTSQYLSTMERVIEAPVPEATRTYRPVENAKLIDLVVNGITKAGFSIDREIYHISPSMTNATGSYHISNVNDSEMQLQIAWQNSYDKTMSLKFAIGAHVFICRNGCVYGDLGSFKKKHVGIVKQYSAQKITEYIKQSQDIFEQMITEREMMKEVEVDKRLTAELLGRMVVEKEFMTTEQLNIIRGELKKPTYNYNAENSLWELYQHCTHSMKISHPRLYLPNLIKTHNMISEVLTSRTGYESPIVTTGGEENDISPNQLVLFQ